MERPKHSPVKREWVKIPSKSVVVKMMMKRSLRSLLGLLLLITLVATVMGAMVTYWQSQSVPHVIHKEGLDAYALGATFADYEGKILATSLKTIVVDTTSFANCLTIALKSTNIDGNMALKYTVSGLPPNLVVTGNVFLAVYWKDSASQPQISSYTYYGNAVSPGSEVVIPNADIPYTIWKAPVVWLTTPTKVDCNSLILELFFDTSVVSPGDYTLGITVSLGEAV